MPHQPSLYLIGSLRNPRIPRIGRELRALGLDVFDDWFSCGPAADDKWQEYEAVRGRAYTEALQGYHARHTFELDHLHLGRCDMAMLVLPAGKSGHLELGFVVGRGKPAYILLDETQDARFDVMYRFATKIFSSLAEAIEELKGKV